MTHQSPRQKFLALSLKSTRKSYYPQLKKHLDSAKENEKRLQLLIDNLPAHVAYINFDERCVLVNHAFEKALGLNRHQILGQRIETLVHKKIYAQVKLHLGEALKGKSGKFEFSIVSKEKKIKWFEVNYVPETDGQGKVNGFYSLTIDLTDKKQAEKEELKLKDRLRQSQKMEAIGTLSGGIAHDFNNILSGIFGYAHLAEMYVNDPERTKEYIGKIVDGAQRASSLVQQILTFSRQTEYSKQPLNLFVVVKEVLMLLRSTIPSNIEIRELLHTKGMILADATQIYQVIMNLCTNASHAMADEGGVLTIGLDEVRPTPAQIKLDLGFSSGKYLKLEIADTGPGIDRGIQEKVFDPYFTTKPMGKGTGLGLAVVDGIVKKHNGIIQLDTTSGVGSCFRIYLPLIKDTRSPVEDREKKQEISAAGSERIMLVDDEPAILYTLKRILTSQGYDVLTFDNGESALQAFAHNPTGFDLIITDMTMPQMTGAKLSREMLKISEKIPIIMCTGYHETFSEKEAFKVGIKRFLHKPILSTELSKVIRELLDKK